MNRTQKFSSSITLAVFLNLAPAFAENAKTMEYSSPDLNFQKTRITAMFSCAKNRDQYCAAIENAKSSEALWLAASEKKQSDDKRTTERLSVLECCLGIDKANSCESLSSSAKEDLKACKKRVK